MKTALNTTLNDLPVQTTIKSQNNIPGAESATACHPKQLHQITSDKHTVIIAWISLGKTDHVLFCKPKTAPHPPITRQSNASIDGHATRFETIAYIVRGAIKATLIENQTTALPAEKSTPAPKAQTKTIELIGGAGGGLKMHGEQSPLVPLLNFNTSLWMIKKYGFSLGYTFYNTDTTAAGSILSTNNHQLEMGTGLKWPVSKNSLRVMLNFFLELIQRRTTVSDNSSQANGDNADLAGGAAFGVWVDFFIQNPLSITLGAELQCYFFKANYYTAVDEQRIPALIPWTVQPALALEVSFSPFRSDF